MKPRTIEKILAGKHAAWCKSITDEATRKVAEENTIITGGAIVSLLTDQPVADFDCYFRTPEAAFKVAQYYVGKLLENPPAAFKDTPEKQIKVFAKLEPAIPADGEAMRIGGVIKGPQPARVRIVVQSAGVAGETQQTDYQYFEGVQADRQADATDAYISAATQGDRLSDDAEQMEAMRAEGQVTDDTEPSTDGDLADAYAERTGQLDDIPADAADSVAGKTKLTKEQKEAQKRGKYRVLYVTSNAITLADQMQLIIRFQGEASQIHANFDYLHATSYWASWERKLVCPAEVLLCIMSKELRYMGSLFPICSVIRLRKFLSRGWTINAGQIVKMAWQISKLDLSDPNVLEEQLVGVDSAYFAQVITCLKERMDKRQQELGEGASPMEVDGTYLMTLIDKVF